MFKKNEDSQKGTGKLPGSEKSRGKIYREKQWLN
jgi:hypothetical protein